MFERSYLSPKTLFTKSIALPLSIASGLCIGKEGPLIHISACVGSLFPNFFDEYAENESMKRELLSASVAAG